MSEVHYIKVHCRDSVFRTLKILRYGGPMGLGNVADSFVPSNSLDWSHVKSGTARETIYKKYLYQCSRRLAKPVKKRGPWLV